jgi:hypothetical protein
MQLISVILVIILFIIGAAFFKKSGWTNILYIAVLFLLYSVFSFGTYVFACSIYIDNSELFVFSGIIALISLLISIALLIINKLIVKRTRKIQSNKKASDVIYTQGRIVKAVKEGTDFNSVPVLSYYYLVIEYEADGKKDYCKTKRSYTLSAISYLLRKYPVAGIEVRDGYCRLPDVPQEEMNAKYDSTILETIKFDKRDRLGNKNLRKSVYIVLLYLLSYAFLFANLMFSNGHITIALMVTGASSILLTVIALLFSKSV